MALVCKAISLKLAQEGVYFTTFFYACLSSWSLSWCLGLCGGIGLIVGSCPPTTYALTGVHLIYIKFNTWRLCWTFLELPSKVGHGMHVHDCFVAQDWHLELVSGSILFDKTYTLFLLNYQIGHDKSSLGVSESTLQYLPFGLCLSTLAFPGRIYGVWSSRGSKS